MIGRHPESQGSTFHIRKLQDSKTRLLLSLTPVGNVQKHALGGQGGKI